MALPLQQPHLTQCQPFASAPAPLPRRKFAPSSHQLGQQVAASSGTRRLQRRNCGGVPPLQHSTSLPCQRRRPAPATTRCSAAAQVSQVISSLQVPPVRDMAAMLVSAVGAVVWVKLFDYFARHDMIEQVSA